MPKNVPVSVIGYWRPAKSAVVGSDMITILRGAKNPVLAHHFLNYLLDNAHGLENFSWLGYMPPLKTINPDKVIAQGYIPKNLGSTIVRESDFDQRRQPPAAHDAGTGDLAERVVRLQGRLDVDAMTRRFLWPSFALPGAVWLVLLFLVPTYAVLAVAFGTVDPIFSNPVPVWNPLHWQFDTMRDVMRAVAARPAVLDGVRAHVRLRRRSRSPAASRSATRSRTTSRGTRAARRSCCSCC